MLPLAPNDAHLWYVFQDEISDPDLIRAYHEMLSADEAERQRRFVFEHLRHEYLVTRALCRWVLSQYADVAPHEWRFVSNEYGRPEIAGPAGLPPIRFNLSNTRGLIACLVTLRLDAGVDVENMTRRGETVAIADRFFAPAEVGDLRALDPSEQRRRFFEYWTLKESYIKACGKGLAIPLGHFSFRLGRGSSISISFTNDITDEPNDWQFGLFQPSELHMMAWGIRRPGQQDLAVELRRVVPLSEMGAAVQRDQGTTAQSEASRPAGDSIET